MAGTRSILGYVQDIDADAFSADRPMSALETLVLRQNTQHLIDMSMQYRFNWCASTSEGGFGTVRDLPVGEGYVTLDAARGQFAIPLVVTITDARFLPSFDVRIQTLCTETLTSGTVTVTLRDVASNAVIFTENITVSTAATTWHDVIMQLTDKPWVRRQTNITHIDMSNTGSLSGATSTVVQLLLLINTRPTPPADGDLRITGVQIREYLSL